MIGESFKLAITALWSHKMRSILTILGVVIGVSSVLAVTSMGAAFESSITSQFDDVDDRSIFVTVGASGAQNGPPDAGQSGFVFTEVDRVAVEGISGVERVVASGEVTVTSITFNGQQRPFETLFATTRNADEIRHLADYGSGGPFTDGASEVVVGYQIAQYLGSPSRALAVGDSLEIKLVDGTTRTATVAGILAANDSLFGENNGQIFVPIDPFYSRPITSPSTGEDVPVFAGFTVISASASNINEVRDAVTDYMRGDSDAQQLLAGSDDVEILVATAKDIQGQISSIFDTVTLFIAGIAGVSLLVGGIMIGTIMLISVTERTKEIGMMKAIGATDGAILWMFLLESAIIGLAGSIVGIIVGTGAGAALVAALFAGEDNISFVIPWDWVGIAVAVGIGTGIIAGLLPARRAVRIEPVVALGYE